MVTRTCQSIALCSVVLALSGSSQAQSRDSKPVVAVFQIEDKGADIKTQTRERLSDYLALTLASTGSYQVIPRAQLTQRLRELKKGSYKRCYDEACQIEIGRELAAQKSLATQIIKLGSHCIVTTILYDLRRSASEGGAQAEGGCSEEELVRSLKQIIATMEGARPPLASSTTDPSQRQQQTVAVNISTTPQRAYLFLDGRGLGWTPLRAELARDRDHVVVLQKRGYQPLRKRVVAKKDGNLHLTLQAASEPTGAQAALLYGITQRQKAIEARRQRNLKTGSEIFALSPVYGINSGEHMGGASLQFFSLMWSYIYWTIFDFAAAGYDGGFMVHLESVLGFPLYLGNTGQHHLKTGLGLGISHIDAAGDFSGMTLVPSVDYFYRTRGRTFFGMGLRLITPAAAFDGDIDVGGAFTLLMRFTVGWARY